MYKWIISLAIALALLAGCGGGAGTIPAGDDNAEQPATGAPPDDDKFPIDDETDIASAFIRSLA